MRFLLLLGQTLVDSDKSMETSRFRQHSKRQAATRVRAYIVEAMLFRVQGLGFRVDARAWVRVLFGYLAHLIVCMEASIPKRKAAVRNMPNSFRDTVGCNTTIS